MIWQTILAVYALLTLAVVMPAGQMMAHHDETKSAGMFAIVVVFWPVLLAVGVIAFVYSPEWREFARRNTGDIFKHSNKKG